MAWELLPLSDEQWEQPLLLETCNSKNSQPVVIALSKQVYEAHQQMLSWLDGKCIDKPKMGETL